MKATFRVWRGDANGGEFRDYTTEVSEGMVVLDAVHDIQRDPGATTSPAAGIVRLASAAPARPKSTACPN